MTAIARSKLNHSLVCCVLVRYVTAKARSKLDHSLVCCVLVRSICDCYSTWSRDKLNHPFTWHDCANDTKMDSPTHLPILSHTATPTYPPTHIRPHPLTHPPTYGHTHLPAHPHTATPTYPPTCTHHTVSLTYLVLYADARAVLHGCTLHTRCG